jgi:hypothetical protein
LRFIPFLRSGREDLELVCTKDKHFVAG